MGMTKYRLYVVAALCLLIFWFILLYTSNYYYTSPYKGFQELHNHSLESTLIHHLHNGTLVNLKNFKFVMNNETICMPSKTTDTSIVIMIHTARSNFDQRYAIRNTWGSVKMLHQWTLHLIFLLGIDLNADAGNYSETDTRLSEESNEHGDLIMGNFVDSYRNLSYKHLMGYKWVSTFCPTAKFILKTDDDVYADIFKTIEVLLVELINSKKTYACENMGGNKPIRESNSKWYAPKELFAEDMYPDFCSGSAYLVKADDAAKIYSISNKTNFFWIDDVFVTGILREKYDLLANNRNEKSLQIFTVYNRHHLGDKKEIINWCSKDNSTAQLNQTFILLNKNEFISDMFCIWNKVRLMRYMVNNV